VLIIAQRLPKKNAEECIEESRALIEEVKQQDWWRLSNEPGVMTMRENVLVNDMTMSGTLFKLWEAIRLCPSAEFVSMLLQYLDTLLSHENREFEEVNYYQKLFLNLYDGLHNPWLSEIAEDIKRRLQHRLRGGAIELIGETPAFNLVQAGPQYLAVSKTLGPTDLFVERLGERDLIPVIFSAKTLEAVKEKIEQFVPRVYECPRLLESLQGYNLVEYEGIVWIVAIAAGPVDLTNPDTKRALLSQGQLMCAATIEDARLAVESKTLEDQIG
jgi:hypothetical protein